MAPLDDHHMHSLAIQRQALQQQLSETELALKELEGAENAYKLVAGMLIATDATTLREDLARRREAIQARLAAMDSQHKKAEGTSDRR